MGLAPIRSVQGKHQTAFESPEDHPVAGIDQKGLVLLAPRSGDFARVGDCDAATVVGCPDHIELACLPFAEIRPVSDVPAAVRRDRLAPGMVDIARAEEVFRLPIHVGKVVFETHIAHGSVSDLHPFMAIHHIRHAVLDPQGPVNCHHVGRQGGVRGECPERPVRRVGDEHLAPAHYAAGVVPVAPLLGEFLAGVECLEEVVLAFIIMEFRGPDAVDLYLAPDIVRSRVDDCRAFPMDEILALVAFDAASGGTDHYIFPGNGVGKHAVVPPMELIKGVRPVLFSARLRIEADRQAEHG